MKNLSLGRHSILEYIENFNKSMLEEDETGVCIENNEGGLDVALDDGDWSYFMSLNKCKYIGSDNEKFLIIPIAEESEDGCDTYLDINNVEVVNTLDVEALNLI